jgi:carboxypeptidase C (cathepsin A)
MAAQVAVLWMVYFKRMVHSCGSQEHSRMQRLSVAAALGANIRNSSAPVVNPYSWVNLTNMIYIDQPVSTGFSPGNITVNDEHDVATQFMGFWKNFIETFSMQGYKVYITGESYAGQYIPYIASAMLDAEDETYYNVKGVNIMDPSINDDSILMYSKSFQFVPAVRTLTVTSTRASCSQEVSIGYWYQ